MPGPTTLYHAQLLWSEAPEALRHVLDGGLLVDGAGRIAASGAFGALAAAHPEAAVVDLPGAWILPGLVDLHTHVPQYEAVATDGMELIPWLETAIFPAESRFSDEACAGRTAQGFFRDQLAWGTTTTVAYSSVHAGSTEAVFREADRAGIRAVIGKVMMDRHVPEALLEDTRRSLGESRELCETWQGRDGGRLGYAFTPRFAPTCSPELLAGVGRLAERHGAWIQTHLSENLDELAWVAQLFPDSRNYVDVYRRAGMLGPRTLLGHGIHLDVQELAWLKEAGASLVHCPRSNAFLKSGIMPLRERLEAGISLGLGSDVAGGPGLSMWAEMAMACDVSKLRWAERRAQARRLEALPEDQTCAAARLLGLRESEPVSAVEVFHLATVGAARALGLSDRIGSLEAGRDADFIVVDPTVGDPGGAQGPDQVLSRLVYRAVPGTVQASYVRGRRCHP